MILLNVYGSIEKRNSIWRKEILAIANNIPEEHILTFIDSISSPDEHGRGMKAIMEIKYTSEVDFARVVEIANMFIDETEVCFQVMGDLRFNRIGQPLN